jgi:hypothetical protein
MIVPLFLSVVLASAPTTEWVDGIGRVDSKLVSHCLVVVGVPEVDLLYDASWEHFNDCVNSGRSRQR